MVQSENENLVRKNIDLPQWSVNVLEEMASKDRRKFKPFVELKLMEIAEQYLQNKSRRKS